MRKFIIKNRTKRKYTKKVEQHSSLLFGKTIFGILPLLIMIIALMTTLAISSPIRMTLSNIHFNFNLSSLFLQNPLPLFQTIGENIAYYSLALVGGLMTGVSTITKVIVLLNPTPLFDLIGSTVQTSISSLAYLFSVLFNALALAAGWALQFVQTLIQNVIFNIIFNAQFIFTGIVTVGNEVVQGVVIIAGAVSTLALFFYHMLSLVVIAIGDWFGALFVAISTWFNHMVQTVSYLISWPFKVLAAYLMQYKPMADTLGKHLNLAFHDMGVCFATFGKTLGSLSSTK